MKKIAVSLVLAGTMVTALESYAAGEATLSSDEKTLTISVDAGETWTYSSALPSTVTKIVKTGAGECSFAPSSIAFTGTVQIDEGTLSGDRPKFGTPAAWKVAVGGALRFDTATSGYTGGENGKPSGSLEIGGMGAGGQAAYTFVMLPNNSPYSTSHKNFAGGVTLTADTAVGGGRFGFAAMDMQGHDLYTYCTNGQARYEMYFNISNPGNIHVKGGGVLLERDMKFLTPITDQCYILANNTTVYSYNHAANTSTYQASLMGLRLEEGASATVVFTGSGTIATNRNPLYGPIHLTGKQLTLNADSTVHYGNIHGSIDGTGTLRKTGTGHVWISNEGTHEFGALVVENGWLTLGANADGSAYRVTNHWMVGGSSINSGSIGNGACARLDLGPGLRTVSDNTYSKSSIRVGSGGTSANQYGIVTIGDGAVVSNEFRLGPASDSTSAKVAAGALYMDDATVYWRGGVSNDGFIGQNIKGYGFLLQNAGTFTHTGYMNLGATGRGIVVQRGGRHVVVGSNPLKIARTGSASYGHYYQGGGTYKGANAWINYNNATNCSAAEAVITTTGAGSVFESAETRVCMSHKDILCIVNVNDGALFKGRIYRDITFSGYKADTMWGPLSSDFNATTRFYLNLNGGVLASTGPNIFGSDRMRCPTRTTVYEKGVTFDTSAGALNVYAPLERPYGKGVKSITLPSNSVTNFNYYVGPPRLRIKQTGAGAGMGASAIVEFNEKTCQATGVTVTSPGVGYEEETTSMTVENNVFGETGVGAFVLEELSVTGGLRKVGANLLTLMATNTYGGATRIEQGAVRFNVTEAWPDGSRLELVGGAAQFARDVTVTNTVKMSFASLFTEGALACDGTLTFGEGAEVEIEDFADEENWRARRAVACVAANTIVGTPTLAGNHGAWGFVRAGNTLKFGYARGTTVIVR